jgi:magnesium-transporting ATPase (P-type)
LSPPQRDKLEKFLGDMAGRALRCLALAHRDFKSVDAAREQYPAADGGDGVDWAEGAGAGELVLDCIVGIIDPLRDDVIDAIATAQGAGVKVSERDDPKRRADLTEGGRGLM